MLLSPMTMGPERAKILALGCTTVREPMVISPCSSLSLHTMAPLAILSLSWQNMQANDVNIDIKQFSVTP